MTDAPLAPQPDPEARTLLVTLNGDDRPGVTKALFEAASTVGAEVLDLDAPAPPPSASVSTRVRDALAHGDAATLRTARIALADTPNSSAPPAVHMPVPF